jgi:hypothetical protein
MHDREYAELLHQLNNAIALLQETVTLLGQTGAMSPRCLPPRMHRCTERGEPPAPADEGSPTAPPGWIGAFNGQEAEKSG